MPRLCSVSCVPRLLVDPVDVVANRHTHTAVASGACTAKFVDSSPQVAPSGQLRPGHTATLSSAADQLTCRHPAMMSPRQRRVRRTS